MKFGIGIDIGAGIPGISGLGILEKLPMVQGRRTRAGYPQEKTQSETAEPDQSKSLALVYCMKQPHIFEPSAANDPYNVPAERGPHEVSDETDPHETLALTWSCSSYISTLHEL